MKKLVFALFFVLGISGGVFWLSTSTTGLQVLGLDLGGTARAWLKDRTVSFLEDLQFKDFGSASTYHLAETQEARDIPQLIRRVFKVRHELLDIHEYKIVDVDFDREGTRARAKCIIFYRVLGDKAMRDNPRAARQVELIIYWFKGDDGKWAMELESSLRKQK